MVHAKSGRGGGARGKRGPAEIKFKSLYPIPNHHSVIVLIKVNEVKQELQLTYKVFRRGCPCSP